MKKHTTVTLLLAGALLAISSCTKSNDASPSTSYPAPDHYVPYWGDNQTLSASGGSDNIKLSTVKRTVVINGVPYTETTTHLLYNNEDYLVTNLDTNNAATDPIVYAQQDRHNITISRNNVWITGSYRMSTFYVDNPQGLAASFVLTVDPSSAANKFAHTMYVGESQTVPAFVK